MYKRQDEIREDVREDVSGRGGSESALRPAGDAVSGEAQATESVIDKDVYKRQLL